MGISSTNNPNQNQGNQDGCKECIEIKNNTDKTQININLARKDLCELLYSSSGEANQQQEKYNGESDLYEKKKCMFVYTEQNYQRYRNLDMTTCEEIIQTNESVKESYKSLSEWNKTLNKTLSTLMGQIKDAKSKFGELKDASCKLESSIIDKCNAGQWKAISGFSANEKCNTDPGDSCKDVVSDFENLTCMPQGLSQDIDIIFQSSADVIGIQLFSNIETLEPMQKTLTELSGKFTKQIIEIVSTRESDLKELQKDIRTSVKNITKSAMDRNAKRSSFEGYYDATFFLCCTKCKCEIKPGKNANGDCNEKCGPRLENCEDYICSICKDVKNSFCCDTDKTKKDCD